jgi:hypothetical protein
MWVITRTAEYHLERNGMDEQEDPTIRTRGGWDWGWSGVAGRVKLTEDATPANPKNGA